MDVIDGNAAAKQGLETLAANHDAIIIATSSFRQGDAPYNYDDFLGALYRATFKAESPFAGCQHAVLGFGDSHFDTYMNCPRLTDSLLEKCGSRRMVKRAEIDVREKERGVKDMATWAAAVDAALKNCRTPRRNPRASGTRTRRPTTSPSSMMMTTRRSRSSRGRRSISTGRSSRRSRLYYASSSRSVIINNLCGARPSRTRPVRSARPRGAARARSRRGPRRRRWARRWTNPW